MKVTLKNVRITFPNLFEARAVNAGDTPRYGASFIMATDSPNVALVKEAILSTANDKWGAKAADILKSLKAGDKLALHDGDAKADKYEGYAGNLFVSASNKTKPGVFDRDRSELVMADGKPYSGCYVNAIVEFWAQDNKYGKRVNASLSGVQFFEDGERLSGGGIASESDFEEIPTDAGAPAEDSDDIF